MSLTSWKVIFMIGAVRHIRGVAVLGCEMVD
jgi:hypothetical protein